MHGAHLRGMHASLYACCQIWEPCFSSFCILGELEVLGRVNLHKKKIWKSSKAVAYEKFFVAEMHSSLSMSLVCLLTSEVAYMSQYRCIYLSLILDIFI